MPLFKRKPFSLVEPPNDLEPDEHVFHVRFTKEIFRDYLTYLQKINLYRQRVWTCKFTGKTNLTYEEALVSEQRATEKVQQFPEQLMEPVLHMIQFSMLKLSDLVKSICTKLQERFMEGLEVNGKKDNCVYPCKILRVLEDDEKVQYEVGWLDNDKKMTGSSVVNASDLIWKKLPFTRDVLKSFIRESSSRSFPWVVHDKLAKKHGISTEPPEELLEKLSTQEGFMGNNGHRRKSKEKNEGTNKGKKLGAEKSEGFTMRKKARKESEEPKDEPVRYPIDDCLVQPGADDPVFTGRPSPSRDFGIPMDCVGDLLMVWNFFTSFARLLKLWPFSLEDFENAICHKDRNPLIVESHLVVLNLLMKDQGGYFMVIQGKKRKQKISLVSWTDYLCDFLEMVKRSELSTHIGTIKRGHYGLLDPQAKLGILRELVDQALATNAFREQLAKYVEQHQALAATRRGEALEEARQRREEKELFKLNSDTKGVLQDHTLENGRHILNIYENRDSNGNIGDIPDRENQKDGNHTSENSESHHVNMASRKVKQQKNLKVAPEDMLVSSNMEDYIKKLQRKKDQNKEPQQKQSREKREHLVREVEKCFVRTSPLGKDRNYNRYWFFQHDGRVFVESSDSKLWGYYSAKEELDALMGSLNCKGERERALKNQLEKYYNRICPALQKRSRDLAQKIALDETVLRRSMRIRAPARRDGPALAFLQYVNKWKD